ncbi:GNAT family N-acetyltransferase [Chloroflexota bacterium]
MLTIDSATVAAVPGLQELAAVQTAHFHTSDPRLPVASHLPSWMILPPGGAGWLAYEDDCLIGALCAEPEFWPSESPFANVFPRDYLRLRLILDPAASAAATLPPLLDRLDGWFRGVNTPGRMLMLPARDAVLTAAMQAEGFTPYHVIAHQPLPEKFTGLSPSNIAIREADDGDIPVIVEMVAESWRFHARYQPAIEISAHLLPSCVRQTRQMLGDGQRQTILLAEIAGQTVGFFAIGISVQDSRARPALFRSGHYGDIYEVGVRTSYRRSGIGAALFQEACCWFRRQCVAGLFVNYAPTNPTSSRFWPKLGFADAWVNWWRS